MKKSITVLLLILPLFCGFTYPHQTLQNKTLSNGSRLAPTPCWFDIPPSKSVQCAYFFPADGQATKLRMSVVLIEGPHIRHQPTPVLYLSGGPGYAVGLDKEGMKLWWDWLKTQNWSHNLVLFDQRGTGLSTPSLECPELRAILRQTLDKPLTQQESFALTKPVIQQCYARLRQAGIDLSNYTTTRNSHDAGDLMELIGGSKQKWNLYGISYGTRLALAILRDYPNRIRSVILDSVYPPEVQELLETPFLYDHVFTTLIKGCQADTSCQTAFPTLEDSLFSLFQQLRQQPLTLTISDPFSEDELKVAITDQNLADIIFNTLYDKALAGHLPAAIVAMQRGQYELLKPMVEKYVYLLLDPEQSEGTYLSVECHDSDPQLPRTAFLAKVEQFPRVKELVKTTWDTWDCQLWKVGDAGPAFRTPVTSKIPTLFLTGYYDPVTPPIWAKATATHFRHGYLFEFPDVGHGAIDSNQCASQLAKSFFQNPHQKPYHKCLEELGKLHFATE